jgi:hypothetical protein
MIREKLLSDRELLVKQLNRLKISFEECAKIGIKENYSIDEFENQGTLIDVVNNAHKRSLI